MEQRLERIENMVGQLITMVGNVLAEQQKMRKEIEEIKVEMVDMRKDINRLNVEVIDMRKDIDQLGSDMQTMKGQLNDVTKPIDFLVHKTGEHEKEIYILKYK